MSRTEKTNSPAIGLDVGTSRIVVARQTEGEIEYESQLNAFVTVPFSQMTANALAREGVPHVVEGDQIVIHGDQVRSSLGELLDKDIRRTMTRRGHSEIPRNPRVSGSSGTSPRRWSGHPKPARSSASRFPPRRWGPKRA